MEGKPTPWLIINKTQQRRNQIDESQQWVKSSWLESETDLIEAAKDQYLATNNNKTKIM